MVVLITKAVRSLSTEGVTPEALDRFDPTRVSNDADVGSTPSLHHLTGPFRGPKVTQG